MPHSTGFTRRRDRPSRDPVSLGDVVDSLMADEVFSRGIPVATLAASWKLVVGERLAAETAPAALENGTLTIRATNGPWGAQARFLGEQIRLNANRALGSEDIRVVRVMIGRQSPRSE